MQVSKNSFKAVLQAQQAQIGLWLGSTSPYIAELCASTGYDWVLIDGEHAPNTVQTMLAQLQAVAAYPVAPVVRPVDSNPALLKQLSDIGGRNFLIPMMESADEASQVVSALRYPPQGTRGIGTALARAALWGGVTDYLAKANEELCILCQVETVAGLAALDDILQVEGVDGVFIGPADLAASLGYPGQSGHPVVVEAISTAMQRIVASGKAAGILQVDVAQAKTYLDLGATFVAVGVDMVLLRRQCVDLLANFKNA